jgi:hypothetical protein
MHPSYLPLPRLAPPPPWSFPFVPARHEHSLHLAPGAPWVHQHPKRLDLQLISHASSASRIKLQIPPPVALAPTQSPSLAAARQMVVSAPTILNSVISLVKDLTPRSVSYLCLLLLSHCLAYVQLITGHTRHTPRNETRICHQGARQGSPQAQQQAKYRSRRKKYPRPPWLRPSGHCAFTLGFPR